MLLSYAIGAVLGLSAYYAISILSAFALGRAKAHIAAIIALLIAPFGVLCLYALFYPKGLIPVAISMSGSIAIFAAVRFLKQRKAR